MNSSPETSATNKSEPTGKRYRSPRLKTRMLTGGLALTVLLGTVSALSVWSQTREEDRIKGEQLLRRAKFALLAANKDDEAALAATQTAQEQTKRAAQMRLNARNLMREGFTLLRDSKRMEASELRTRAEASEILAKHEMVEVRRLRDLLAHQKQVISDTGIAAANIRDAAANVQDAGEKAEMGKMAESLRAQGAEMSGEAAATEKSLATTEANVSRVQALAKSLNEAADRLAPPEK